MPRSTKIASDGQLVNGRLFGSISCTREGHCSVSSLLSYAVAARVCQNCQSLGLSDEIAANETRKTSTMVQPTSVPGRIRSREVTMQTYGKGKETPHLYGSSPMRFSAPLLSRYSTWRAKLRVFSTPNISVSFLHNSSYEASNERSSVRPTSSDAMNTLQWPISEQASISCWCSSSCILNSSREDCCSGWPDC